MVKTLSLSQVHYKNFRDIKNLIFFIRKKLNSPSNFFRGSILYYFFPRHSCLNFHLWGFRNKFSFSANFDFLPASTILSSKENETV
jgi:hypothetical protein